MIYKVIFHFIGNSPKWLSQGGQKSMDEIMKEDNSIIGFIIIFLITFFYLGLK
jgi:hypothetical protein